MTKKFFDSIGAQLRRVVVAATLVAIGTLASCHKSTSPPNGDGGHDGPTDIKPKVDGGTDGSADACVASGTPGAIGAACSCNGQCASKFCVENVCCSSACTEGCQTCSAADSVGTCVKRPAGADPRKPSDCSAQPAATCGLDGKCDGSGACRHFLGTTCVGGTCNGDAVVGAYACDGTGQCKPGVTMLCLPYTCDAASGDCFQKCTSNNQCSAQACDFATESCGKGGIGAHCDTTNDCISGKCADHVCCNVLCEGACVACNLPGRLGTCWPVDSGKPDPRGVCTDKGEPSCGHNGTCDGVGGCANYVQDVQCLAPSCTGNRLNTAGTCDGLGTCRPAGVQDCHPFKCLDGACTHSCQTDKDCDTGTACVNNTCGPKPIGFACGGNSECKSNQCVDGVCCDSACTGACHSCNLPTSPGHCLTIAAGNTDPRGVCSNKGAASCGTNGLCNGSGSCDTYPSGTVCSAETCAQGLYTPASTCNMTGQCVAPDSRACAPYVCNGTQCFNACATNDQCKTPNSCTMNSCGLKTNGAACSAAAECGSTFCAQGICCNKACTGACQSCALTNALGTCTSVPVNAVDPAGMCKDVGAPSCGTDGKCDGNGSCQKYVQGTTCIGSSCPVGTTVFTAASTCDGAGKCVTPGSGPCFPYQCGVNVCKNSCTSDADCASPAVCNAMGSCGLKSNGQTCGTAAECSSGFCSQQTCCATACQGACQSCGLTNSLGTCTNVANGQPDPQATCHDAGNASCGTDGFCDGSGACRLYAGGTSCAAPVCPTGASTLTSGRTCNGKGVCQPATTIGCAPYVCNGSTACKAACAVDGDCLSPDICDTKTNLCGNKKRLGQACTATSDCLTGDSCVDLVCCSATSCAVCQACNVGSSAGNCAPVPANATEPHIPSLCTANPPCGNTGACNGAGACQLGGTGVSCGNQSCTGATFTPVSNCNGSGACAAPTSSTCGGGFNCDTTNKVCKTTCTADTDCVAPLTCQGSGSTKSCALKPNGQACTTGQCISGNCVSGICCGTTCPAAPPCGNTGTCSTGVCDQAANTVACGLAESCSGTTHQPPSSCSGAGTCNQNTTAGCTTYVCGTTTCKTSCAVDADCVNPSSHYCSGGACAAKQASGATCSGANQCSSGNCVDGRCCGSASCPVCQVCTGAGGTCANVGTVADPHGGCAASPPCGNTGTCNGAGACTQAANTVACGLAESCSGTTHQPPSVCSGSGTCSQASTAPCSTYVCGTTTCKTSCAVDADCVNPSSHYCSAGTCVAKGGNGASCTATNQCTSGNCVDGICCLTSSCGTCQTCGTASGICANVTGGLSDPHGRCPASPPCGNVGGICNGSGACTQFASGDACGLPEACSGTTHQPPSSCSGAGSCDQTPTGGCGNYACGTTTCKTTCTADTDCASTTLYCTGNTTTPGSCNSKQGLGATCTANNQCSQGNCVDGVCCDSTCGAACHACNVPGNVGTCTVTTGASCGAGASCTSPSQFTSAAVCASNGICSTSTTNCMQFLCTASGCPDHCNAVNDCIATAYCTGLGGTCQPRSSAGGPCTGTGTVDQCQTGLFCTDGVCCTSNGCGTCAACNINSSGTCAPTGSGAGPSCPVEAPSTCGTKGCNGSGTCLSYDATTVCAAAVCAGDGSTFTTPGFCDGVGGGNGTCVPGIMGICSSMMCDTTGCLP